MELDQFIDRDWYDRQNPYQEPVIQTDVLGLNSSCVNGSKATAVVIANASNAISNNALFVAKLTLKID